MLDTLLTQDPCFVPLKEHVIAATGMAYYRNRDADLADLIGRRLAALGLDDCHAYLDMLAEGAAGSRELDDLVSLLTIGETYFFRDREQFDAIRDVIIPQILARNQDSRRLRIWSAGCATGAEPYSLAILLGREMAQRLAGWHVSIVATDINRRFLASASQGIFQEWALRSTSTEARRQCFSTDGHGWQIHPDIKQWVTFAHFNLVENEFPSPHRGFADFDLILCRNVMIYFDADTTRRLIRQFHASLANNGWFLVGSAEPNLESFTAFQVVDAAGTTLYRKHASNTQMAAAGTLVEAGDSAEHTPPAPPRPGPLASGEAAKAPLVRPSELDPVAHYYQALWLEEMQKPAEAERCLRHALYLDRRFVLAHYHLGLNLKRSNRPAQARRSFENVLQLLHGQPGEADLLHAEHTTVASLAALARMQLESLEHR